MPKTAVHEYRGPLTSKDDVRPDAAAARQVDSKVTAVSVARRMKRRAQCQFGARVAATVRLHVPAPGVGLGGLPRRRDLLTAQLIRDLADPTKARWRWWSSWPTKPLNRTNR